VEKDEPFEIVGRSPAIAKVQKLVDRVAGTTFPVLVEGEPGTGKELFARAVHGASPRRERPFLALDAAVIAGSLLEAELFGEAGHAGVLERAQGGTLLLDEVGELARDAQAALLRVLQEGKVRRVGSERAVAVDVRLVATATGDLRERVRAGSFREDLYFRLAVLRVKLPALRERREDLPELLRALLEREARALGRDVPRVDADALEPFFRHEWPGNVRELEAVAKALLELGGKRVSRAAAEQVLGPRLAARPASGAGQGTLREIERAAIAERLEANRWQQARTARSLGIDRKTLYRKIREYGISGPPPGSLVPPPEDGE
jgi:DNA-binding NtrC family response regulator